MKILFIGGTGLISSAVSPALLARGDELVLLNRGNDRSLEARYIIVDINDEAAVQSALGDETFDVVCDWIAFTTAQVERDIRLFEGRTKQYIFISSASAYTKPVRQHPITESHPLGNRYWEYSQNKADCERLLFDRFQSHGFPVTVVRPSHTYGGDKLLLPLSNANTQWTYADRIIRGAPIVVPGDGTSLWTVTHNTDFAKGFIGLCGNTQAVGHAFHITSDEALSWDRIVEIQADALGAKANILHIASDYLTSRNPELLGPLTGDKSATAVFDNSKIKSFVPSFICTTPFTRGASLAVELLLRGDRTIDDAYNAEQGALCNDYIKRMGL